jgi:hypothetical protein
MVLSAALLAQYSNIKKNIYYPIQKLNQARMLSNGENVSVIPAEKKLQIIAQNKTHISTVMPCSSEVLDESGNIFRIEGPYKLNCSESRIFNYIKQYRTWRRQKCCSEPDTPDYMIPYRLQGHLQEFKFFKCGLCINYCKVTFGKN